MMKAKPNKFIANTHDVVMIVRTSVEFIVFIIFVILSPHISWLQNFPGLEGLKLGVSAALSFSIIILLIAIYRKRKNLSIKALSKWESIGDAILVIWLIYIFGGTQGPFFFFYFLILMEAAFTFSLGAIIAVGVIGILGTVGEFGYYIVFKDFIPNVEDYIFLFFRLMALSLISYYGYSFARSITRENKALIEVRKKSRDIKAKNLHLQKLLKMRSEFLDTASHQLRTPTSVVNSTLEMLIKGQLDDLSPEDRNLQLKGAYLKCRKLDQIITDILDASEMDTEPFKIHPRYIEEIQIEDLLGKIKEDFTFDIKNKGLIFTLTKPKTPLPKVKGMERYLEQAIRNLADNAVKYTPKKNEKTGEKGKVLLSCAKDDNNIIVKVIDNGIGIPKEDFPKMFEKFGRASNAKEMYTDGTGLGLFIVKQIIEGHKGKLSFESKKGKGTTFKIILPIKSKL